MKVKSKRAFWLVLGGTLVIAIGVQLVRMSQEIRQDNLDHALVDAARRFDAPNVHHLLDLGANANAANSGEQPMTAPEFVSHQLARLRRQPMGVPSSTWPPVLFLLLTTSDDDVGYPPKAYAARDEIMAALIKHGADVNRRPVDPYGDDEDPLLRIASSHGYDKTLRLLLAGGADVNARGYRRQTPLMGADADGTRHCWNVAQISMRKTSTVTALPGGYTTSPGSGPHAFGAWDRC